MEVVTEKGVAYTTLDKIGLPLAKKFAECLQAICAWDVDEKTSLSEPDLSFLSLLIDLFGVEYVRARTATRTLTLEDFSQNLARLEKITGQENAADIVKSGKFLDYRNSALESYLKLASAAAHKSPYPIPEEKRSLFYSITALAECVDTKTVSKHKKEQKLPSFNIRSYRILHHDNELSCRYLESLINDGLLEVGLHEHWCKGETDSSFRGGDILKKIGRDLHMIFYEFGFQSPQCKYLQGKHQLIISEEARQNLAKVKEYCQKFVYKKN